MKPPMPEAWGLRAARQGLSQVVGRCCLGAGAGAGAGRVLWALAGATAARQEVMHDVSRSRDKAWASFARWEGLIRAVVLTLICKDCSTGITQLGIMVFNQGGRTQVP